MIQYLDSLEDITADQLNGFYVGWGNPPAPPTLLKILHGSFAVVLAMDSESNNVVGMVNAISDGFHTAFIPHLEVLPDYKGKGIGTELMWRMLKRLETHYAIDLMCDAHVQPFYDRLGMQRSTGMVVRNFARQHGEGD